MRIISAIALLVVMSAFQNCAETGFGSNGMGDSAFNSKSKDGTDDPIKTTPPPAAAFPTGEFIITHIWNKYVCNAPAGAACPAIYAMESKISGELKLSISSAGKYTLTGLCFKEQGIASFTKWSGNKYAVSFKPNKDYSTTELAGCELMRFALDLVRQQAINLFHSSNLWVHGNLEGFKNTDYLTDGKEHYLLINGLKKVDPVIVDTFYVNGIEQRENSTCIDPVPVPVNSSGQETTPPVSKCRSGWVSYTPMHEKVVFTLGSDRKFKLEANCLIMTGSMPLLGASPSGFGIKVIVDKYEATCKNAGQRQASDPTVVAFEVLKGGVDYSISATGDATHRIRDAKGRALYMSKQYYPIYVTVNSGVSYGDPGQGI